MGSSRKAGKAVPHDSSETEQMDGKNNEAVVWQVARRRAPLPMLVEEAGPRSCRRTAQCET